MSELHDLPINTQGRVQELFEYNEISANNIVNESKILKKSAVLILQIFFAIILEVLLSKKEKIL